MVINTKYWTKVLKKVLILAISLLAIFLLFKLAIFYIPFLIGIIISLIIEPIIKIINNKTQLTRKTSAVIVLLVIFTLLIALITWGIVSMISEASSLIQNLNTYVEKIYTQIESAISKIDLDKVRIPEQVIEIIESSANSLLNFSSKWINNLLNNILQGFTKIPIIGIYIVITILSTYFICTDKLYMLDQFEHHFPKKMVKKIGKRFRKITKALGSYLKAEAILIFISFIEVLIGLYIFKWFKLNVPYPFLAALRNCFC